MDIKKIAAAVIGLGLLGVAGAVGFVAMQPSHIHVERQIVLEATAADVAPFAEDLKKVNEWSPWDEKDPELKREYSEATTGVGAWYAWDGNDDVGAGKQTILVAEPGHVVHELHFLRPFEAKAEATIDWTEAGGKTTVVWAYDDRTAGFMTKGINLVASMDSMLGPDFAKGLALLEPLVASAVAERVAEEARLAEEEAKAQEEAEAAAAAAEEDGKKKKKKK